MDGSLFQRHSGSFAQAADGGKGQAHFAVLHHILAGIALAQLNGQELTAALQHFIDQLQADKGIIVLSGTLILGDLFVIPQVLLGHAHTANSCFIVDIRAANGKVHSIEDSRVVHLEPHQADGRHQVGNSVSLGEHILDLAAGFDVPIRHIMLLHGFFPAGLKAALGHLAFTHGLHNVK